MLFEDEELNMLIVPRVHRLFFAWARILVWPPHGQRVLRDQRKLHRDNAQHGVDQTVANIKSSK